MYEQHTEGLPKIGFIKRVQQRGPEIRIIFEFNEAVPPLTIEQIEAMRSDLGLTDFEFSRTHSAVKSGDLYAVLRDAGHPPEQAAAPAQEAEERGLSVDVTPTKVFLVHGRDEAAKHAVARFLEWRVGLDVIILNERPNQGRSILTKFKEESDGATFAVVPMTPDDLGCLRRELLPYGTPALEPRPRARENVIFEPGFFIGQLGVDRVCALVPPGVERPSDYDGIVYVQFDDQDSWQKKLVTELHAANVPVSADWWKAGPGTRPPV
jgi:predicted nucleotide-binding protein